MRMTVVDQLHISAISPHTMPAGTVFEVTDDLGKTLAKRGLAAPAEGSVGDMAGTAAAAPGPAKTTEKAERKPGNKAKQPPANKAEQPPATTAEQPPANKAEQPPANKAD